ncbi:MULTISPECIES: hypothetical protein [Paenibacillus]|jgi:hypothetical protein|uniref:Uncharacterized protein n=1 Tax=Paenibacillus lactis TaxID=228574 RepID=A0ABS4FI61_9BACL|nr:hypothetical protein [Paenibacillus lactis]MBP1895943.1 hypothetical protein [Paenibacillus lactis]GIO90295.1 hypothetical protein J31TS3_15220 [Paenibacillus lactis]
MNWQDIALVIAGIIGIGVALVHGILIQRGIVRPLVKPDSQFANDKIIKRIIPGLIQFSTFNWILGGIALIASIWFERDIRLVTGLLVGSSYLYGTLLNFWGTRGRHPAWLLYAVALVLIAFGVTSSSS